METEVGVRLLEQAKECQGLLAKQGQLGRSFPHTFRGSAALPTPWPWTSSLQNCETAEFCFSSFPMGALADSQTRGKQEHSPLQGAQVLFASPASSFQQMLFPPCHLGSL